jgi:hypothetical protein
MFIHLSSISPIEIKYLSSLKNFIFSIENLWPFFKVNLIVGELF